MASQRYQSPLTPMGWSHSDPVTSDLRRKVESRQCHISPEVVSVMADDAAGKFLQLMFLWMEKCLVSWCLRQSSSPSFKSGIPCEWLWTLCLQSWWLGQLECQGPCWFWFNSNPVQLQKANLDYSLSYSCSSKSYYSRESKSEKTGWGLSSGSINTSSPSKERIINNLTAALLMKVITKVSRKTRKSLTVLTIDINPTIRPLDEINIPNSAVEKNLGQNEKAQQSCG